MADEILYQARIHPESIVGCLDDEHVKALHAALQYVVQFASDVEADDMKYPRSWLFHYRHAASCWQLLKVCWLFHYRHAVVAVYVS